MSNNPDYKVMETAYTVLDRIEAARGMGASTDAARAVVTLLRDIDAGRAVVTKETGGAVRARYKTVATKASGGSLVDQVAADLNLVGGGKR